MFSAVLEQGRWFCPLRATVFAGLFSAASDAQWDTCDVADPISPSATADILRLSEDLVEHLVLGDRSLCSAEQTVSRSSPLIPAR
jgi:hypothetical protein